MASSERLCTELALLGTLLLYCVFSYAFRIAPPESRQVTVAEEPDCILLTPLSMISSRSPEGAWEREVHAWCLLADPTLMSLPNDRVGFGSVRSGERILPNTPIPLYECPVALDEETLPRSDPLFAELPSITDEIRGKWDAVKPQVPPAVPMLPLPRGVHWRWRDGRLLNDTPEIELAAAQAALRRGERPVGPTVVEVDRSGEARHVGELGRIHTREGEFARVRVRETCGNTLLDELVVVALRAKLLSQYRRSTEEGEPVAEREYLPQPGKTLTFAVEWRLMPVETVSTTGGGDDS